MSYSADFVASTASVQNLNASYETIKLENKQEKKESFIEYVKRFYFTGGIYSKQFFNDELTNEDIVEAVDFILKYHNNMDSITRELTRDFMLHKRGYECEHTSAITAWLKKDEESDSSSLDKIVKDYEQGNLLKEVMTINMADAYKDVRESDCDESLKDDEILTDYENSTGDKDYWVQYVNGDVDCWSIQQVVENIKVDELDLCLEHLNKKDIEAIKINYNKASTEPIESFLNKETLPNLGKDYLEDELTSLMQNKNNGAFDSKSLKTIEALLHGGVCVSNDTSEKFEDFLKERKRPENIKNLKNLISSSPTESKSVKRNR